MNPTALKVLASLRKHQESCDDGIWALVYLDNARPDGVSIGAFRGALSYLSKFGLYKVVDGYAWGVVKMTD